MMDDLLRQIVHIDDGFVGPGIGELVEDMIQQRTPGDTNQRLRHPVGQRAHAHAEAGCEYHGFAGSDGHAGISAGISCWTKES